jgi:hypothetical protein
MQVFNKKYWPYQYRLLPGQDPPTQAYETERFCYTHFRSGDWRNNGLYFVFKRQEDATFFLLRFGA